MCGVFSERSEGTAVPMTIARLGTPCVIDPFHLAFGALDGGAGDSPGSTTTLAKTARLGVPRLFWNRFNE
jgi:hypothetical protein